MTAVTAITKAIADALGVAESAVLVLREGELALEVATSDLSRVADALVSRLDARLMTLFATDERQQRGVFVVHQIWSCRNEHVFLRVTVAVDPADAAFPSIAAAHPSANWFEREVMDVFGLTPTGHPNPTRVALHDDWPEGEWAMRKDFPDDRQVARTDGASHPFRPVLGEGVFQVPVGPVHAGIIEPGHFRFGVAGEPILYLQIRLFYTHKGIEKRFERLPWRHGLYLAESISGDTAVGHALAYAHAIERLAGLDVPGRARALRTVLLELERIYNHVADIGAIATDVAFTLAASRFQALREGMVRLNERVFGTRLLRGTVAIGGVTRDVAASHRDEIQNHLAEFQRTFDSLMAMLIDAGSFTDRIDGPGVLTTQAARDLGVVGLAARASGVDGDFRHDHPHDGYGKLDFVVPVEQGGDVRARLMVRARDVAQSLVILRQVLSALPDTPLRICLPGQLPPSASALGWAEAWRGPVTHWVATDERGSLTRVKVTDPSSLNWPGLVHAVPGNIIPDFPVINKSFNLSYSGNDR
jgi:Ni,Fe-hydrogenase III large subunit/Ni,Fe-hydrogenase III component G